MSENNKLEILVKLYMQEDTLLWAKVRFVMLFNSALFIVWYSFGATNISDVVFGRKIIAIVDFSLLDLASIQPIAGGGGVQNNNKEGRACISCARERNLVLSLG